MNMTPSDCRHYAARAIELGLIRPGAPVSKPAAPAPLGRKPGRTVAAHRPLVEKIQHAVCAHYKITLGELLHKNRLTADTVWARAVAVHLCREILTINRHDLAAAFHRTAATISNLRNLVAHQTATSHHRAAEVHALTQLLRAQLKLSTLNS